MGPSKRDLRVRDSARTAIKRYLAASKDEGLSLNREQAAGYLELLQEQWSRFCSVQETVEALCEEEELEEAYHVRAETEDEYLQASVLLNKHIKIFNSIENVQAAVATSPVVSNVHLPRMELPTFEGDPTEWIAFHDGFVSLVDTNNQLTGTQKLHYLRCSLKGEPLQLINNFQISEANYEEAWCMLNARYKSVRVIVEHHMLAIFSVVHAQSDSAEAIKCVLDKVTQNVLGLKALGRPVEFWDDWLVHMVVSKLAYETRKQWELSLVDDELPSFEDLQTFLEIRCRSLGMLSKVFAADKQQNNKQTKRPTTNTLHANAAITASEKCSVCDSDHKIYSCERYSMMLPDDRLRFIRLKHACLNCPSNGHYVNNCRSNSTCRIYIAS